ncbi:MAG: helicase-associated domain-containing protein [Egibacteraceae bacterium]
MTAISERLEGEVTARSTEAEAQANFLAVLQLCAAGKLRCSEKTRRPSAATVATVRRSLVSGDFYADDAIAAFAWPLLLQAGGLAELAGSRLQLTTRGRSALGKPPVETIRHLWQRWQSHGVIDEMSRVEEIKGQRTANTLTAVKPRRQCVEEALATCPVGEWVRVDELFATMRRKGLSPTVARNDRAIWNLYICEREYGSLGYLDCHDWEIIEGRYTMCVLFEYMATLGLIDVSYGDPVGARDDFRDNWGADDLDYLSRYDGLDAVRLNAMGAWVLGLVDRYEPVELSGPAAFDVLPNLDVVAVGEVSPADRLLLDAFAGRSSERVWSLARGTVLAAIAAGRELDELRSFLGRARHDLPSTVVALLDDVAACARQVRDLGVVHAVECADPAVAVLIARDRKLRKHCHLIGDRHLVIPLEHETAFRAALPALGYALPLTGPGGEFGAS